MNVVIAEAVISWKDRLVSFKSLNASRHRSAALRARHDRLLRGLNDQVGRTMRNLDLAVLFRIDDGDSGGSLEHRGTRLSQLTLAVGSSGSHAIVYGDAGIASYSEVLWRRRRLRNRPKGEKLA